MIIGKDPRIILLIGFCLVLIGIILPLLMVMHYLQSTLLLNLIAYASSFFGVMLGIVGALFLAVRGRKRDM